MQGLSLNFPGKTVLKLERRNIEIDFAMLKLFMM